MGGSYSVLIRSWVLGGDGKWEVFQITHLTLVKSRPNTT